MGTINLKLVLIILLAIIIGGLLGSIITKEISKRESPTRWLEKESATSAPFLQADPTQLLNDLYDKEQDLFKMSKDSPASIEATYCAAAIHGERSKELDLNQVANIDEMFNKIRSYYTAPGYYLEKGKDSVSSTWMALEIDSYFPQNLEQEIDLNWLKSNSLENENLEESKLDPQYQRDILEIYRYLPLDQKEVKTRITPVYLNYYCNYKSQEISDEDYLRKKYYQTSIINYLTGSRDTSAPRLCLKEEDIETDKDRLNKISFSDLSDIKEVYWLYDLKKIYNLRPDLREFFTRVGDFYFNKVFKEKLSDKEPNLIGTLYGMRCGPLYSSYIQAIKKQQ